MTTPQPAALPELPEPSGVIFVGTQAMRAFTADQMRAYALAALQAQPAGVSDALVKLVEAVEAELSDEWTCNSYHPSLRPALEAARAILALRPQAEPDWRDTEIARLKAVISTLEDQQLRAAAAGLLRPQEVPMTYEQMRATLTEAGYDDANFQARADFINGVRYGEAHHGITAPGAQDGEGK